MPFSRRAVSHFEMTSQTWKKERKEFILSGHWSAIGIQAYKSGITIDTGCVWGRKLSAYNFEEKKIISINADHRDLF